MSNERLNNCKAIYEMAKKLNPSDLDKVRVYTACLLTMGAPKETKDLIDGFIEGIKDAETEKKGA